MMQREMPYRSMIAEQLLVAPRMPSMSSPRCVWASKMSAPAGSSARSSASKAAKSSCARSSGSLTL